MKTVRLNMQAVITASYLYLALPVLVFFAGWLKWYVALPCALMLVGAVWIAMSGGSMQDVIELPVLGLAAIFFVALIWGFLSGIGGCVWQRFDWNARNALMHDLIDNSWPVVFEDGGGLTYYLGFFLVPALFGKLGVFFAGNDTLARKAVGWNAANAALFTCSVIGLVLIMILLCGLLSDRDRISFAKAVIVPVVLMLWGGLNLMGQLIVFAKGHPDMLALDCIYSWSEYQYTPNYGLVAWVFNQAIPAWIVAAVYMHERKSGRAAGYGLLLMLLIPFAPFCAVGVAPLMVADIVRFRGKELFSRQNVLSILAVLPVYVAYYGCNTAVSGGAGDSGAGSFIGLYRLEYFGLFYNLLVLLIFLFLEVGVYALLLWRRNGNDYMFKTVVVWLFIIPLIKLGPTRDFMLRGSVVPLFMLMFYMLDALFDKEFRKKRTLFAALVIAMLIGCYSGAGDIVLTLQKTADPVETAIRDDLGSMNNQDVEWWTAYTRGSSYVVPDAGDTFFFGKLGR